jgi:hypothetical protein
MSHASSTAESLCPTRSSGYTRFERIKAVSDPMRELIEDLWPELAHKLPPKKPQ